VLKTFPLARLVIAVCLGGTLSACPLAGKKEGDGGARRDSGAGGRVDAGTDEPDEPEVDAGRDSGVRSDAGRDGGADGSAVVTRGTTPELESVTARQSGRFGTDLRIDVTGTDRDGDTVALRLAVFGKGGSPINLGDSNQDGKADPGPMELALAAVLPAEESATSYLVVRDLFAANAGLERVEVSLVDATKLSSETVSAEIEKQPVLDSGALCDATYVENRCKDGFGCKGNVPTVCMPGEAPKIVRAVYYSDDLGTRVLVEGTDADTDVKSYVVEFLSSTGAPVMIDTDGDIDNKPDANKFEADAVVRWDGTKFFLRLDQGETFADVVSKVRVKLVDRGGLVSAAVTADKMAAPVRSAGQVCDVRTFDRCASNTVCYSSNGGKNYACTATGTARTKSCGAALTLSPTDATEGKGTVRGVIAGPSLWEPPQGCVPGMDSGDQPEAVVKLVLVSNAKKVTLSTNNAYTSFDSTVYMMSKCDGSSVLAWCNDYAGDGEVSGAELVMNDVPAGTYYVAVDSFNSLLSGTTFQLDVSVE
jgi:hypothetical protein